jgi:uncharacterized caspase-like protein
VVPASLRLIIAALLALVAPCVVAAQTDPTAEKRIAVVIGNSDYRSGALATPANDAGLIAQTLEAAGFDVVGARDLDQDTLRRSFRDFLDKAEASGPNTVAFIYLSGYGLQLEGENYYVPIDARIARESALAAEAVRISDYTRPLAALNLKTSIVVVDAARPHPFAQSGAPLAGGLALAEPEPGMIIAFNAAPDTVAPEGPGPYGPYAQALAEMMREGGLPLGDVFNRVRLRVNDVTKGAQVPWHASKVQGPFVFFEREPDAPPPAVSLEQTAAFRARPIRDFDAHEAYLAALERDTLQGYLDFLAAYPHDPMARRVRAIVAARREAITWHRTRGADTPEAYWSYLDRYPRGRHASEARRRLAFLAAALEPPPSFTVIEYDDCPPPPPEEYVYVERRVLIFDDPEFEFSPPPPPPFIFLPPPPPEFIVLPPPPPPVAIFVLPIPVYRPVPIWVRPPHYVAPPPAHNVVFNNIHNTVVINNTTNIITVTKPDGQTTSLPPPARPAASPETLTPVAAAVGPRLPPSVAKKAAQIPHRTQMRTPEQPRPQQPQQPGQPLAKQPSQAQPGSPLPGPKGLALPQKGPQPPATLPPPAQPAASPEKAIPPAPTAAPALPPSAAQKAPQLPQSTQPSSPEQPQAQQPQPGQPPGKQHGQVRPLPGTKGLALPQKGAKPPAQPAASHEKPSTPAAAPALPPSAAQKASQIPQGAQPGSQEQSRPQQAQQPGQRPAKQSGDARPGRPLPGRKELPQALVPPAEPRPPGHPSKPKGPQPSVAGEPWPKGAAMKGIPDFGAPQQGPRSGQHPSQTPLERRWPQQPEQQRHKQIEQQRYQQLEQRRQKQVEQQRQQPVQLRQKQVEQQRQQHPVRQRQVETKQLGQPPARHTPQPGKPRKDCGGPQQPPCPK